MMSPVFVRRVLVSACAAGIFAAGWIATGEQAHAQRPKQAAKPVTKEMTTKDGVKIEATYYESSAGKDATPVVLLADWKDSRSVYDQLAKRLQDPRESDTHKSFAVLAVDLRGHGDSTKQKIPGRGTQTIDAAKLGRNDLAAMVRYDMEAVRSFLVDENDAGKLNINRLSILGSGLGASVAVNWTAVDWSAPPLAVGKQGQDVKALILVSPQWSYKGLQMTKALRHRGVREKVAFLIMYGSRDRSATSDAKRIESQLERYHPEPDSLKEGEPHSLSVLGADINLQGTQFLTEAGSRAEDTVIKFLSHHVSDGDYEWSRRRRE